MKVLQAQILNQNSDMKDLIGSLSQQNTLPRSCAAGLESLSGRGGVGLTEPHTLNNGSHSLGRDATMTPQNESPVTLPLTVTVFIYFPSCY
jgi:hypothetical protein